MVIDIFFPINTLKTTDLTIINSFLNSYIVTTFIDKIEIDISYLNELLSVWASYTHEDGVNGGLL